jgi:hypothetical protein
MRRPHGGQCILDVDLVAASSTGLAVPDMASNQVPRSCSACTGQKQADIGERLFVAGCRTIVAKPIVTLAEFRGSGVGRGRAVPTIAASSKAAAIVTVANPRLRTAAFQCLFWANAIGWSAAIVWTAGLPLMDLKKLAADEPMSWQVTGTPELQSLGQGSDSRLILMDDRHMRSIYRCDLPGSTSTTCVPWGTALPAGSARIDYVDLPEGTGSTAHRMPLNVVVGDEVVYRRPYEEAISTARTRCLLRAIAGVGLWVAVNLALTALWKRGRRSGA